MAAASVDSVVAAKGAVETAVAATAQVAERVAVVAAVLAAPAGPMVAAQAVEGAGGEPPAA